MIIDDLFKVISGISQILILIIIIAPFLVLFLYYRFRRSLVFNVSLVITLFAFITGIVASMFIYAIYFVPSIAIPLQVILIPIVLAILILFSFYLNKTVFKPMSNFVEVNEQLSKGNFNVEFETLIRNNELGQLNKSLKTTFSL